MHAVDEAISVEGFRLQAREWLAHSMTPLPPGVTQSDRLEWDEEGDQSKVLQRRLYDAGYAGIAFPVEYGGRGLTPEHQRVFAEEASGYEMPLRFDIPTLTVLGATLLDYGTEAQKVRYIPAMLKGDEYWAQFMSEPSGGSDLAGCLTRATREGDQWVINGSKVWSSGAFRAQYALCLARTDWDVPKHAGLTTFIVKVDQPSVQLDRIQRLNGSREFCQEFLDDVIVTDDDVVGDINDGWAVTTRLLFHERNGTSGGSPYGNLRSRGPSAEPRRDLVNFAALVERSDDALVCQQIAEAHILDAVHGHLITRVLASTRSGTMPAAAGSMLKLFTGMKNMRRGTIALDLSGADAVVWERKQASNETESFGDQYLSRQARCLAGGSNEMQRNIISERMLGMPRELGTDAKIPFSQARHNDTASPSGDA
jgi:alkylation response protein AidB-like acyl-CoA dehydrogenase